MNTTNPINTKNTKNTINKPFKEIYKPGGQEGSQFIVFGSGQVRT